MQTHRFHHRQQGLALAMVMLFLLVLSMVAVTAARDTTQQERLSGALRNATLADNGAETALRGAEVELWNSFVLSDGRVLPAHTRRAASLDALAEQFRHAPDWVELGEAYAGVDYMGLALWPGTAQLPRAPRYQIENLGRQSGLGAESHGADAAFYGGGSGGDLQFFRLTARSTSGDDRQLRVRESTFVLSR